MWCRGSRRRDGDLGPAAVFGQVEVLEADVLGKALEDQDEARRPQGIGTHFQDLGGYGASRSEEEEAQSGDSAFAEYTNMTRLQICVSLEHHPERCGCLKFGVLFLFCSSPDSYAI